MIQRGVRGAVGLATSVKTSTYLEQRRYYMRKNPFLVGWLRDSADSTECRGMDAVGAWIVYRRKARIHENALTHTPITHDLKDPTLSVSLRWVRFAGSGWIWSDSLGPICWVGLEKWIQLPEDRGPFSSSPPHVMFAKKATGPHVRKKIAQPSCRVGSVHWLHCSSSKPCCTESRRMLCV